jgi:oxygen-independent coproporphyrinogen-3 oxidase
MAGIYIHIPFCKQRCFYCDFYKTTQLSLKSNLIESLSIELKQRKEYIDNEIVETIYFGGGTPSLLTKDEIKLILDTIHLNYNVKKDAEITIEANPDDLSTEYIKTLAQTNINRLSIGIQSFQDAILQKMNRRHNANQAINCIKQAQHEGFNNISADLIYGIPELSVNTWIDDLNQMEKLNIQHLSAYHLTIEPNTKFGELLKKNKISIIKESDSIQQFNTLINWAKTNNFEHYEISNFAKNGLYSQHNTNYWKQKKYLGIGPSAHSYNQKTRSWNIANTKQYIDAVNNNKIYSEIETLTETDKYNEFLITWLRTKWGINLIDIKKQFGNKRQQKLLKLLEPFIKDNSINFKNNYAILSNKGIFISDLILSNIIDLNN